MSSPCSLDIRLKRPSRVYHEGENLVGLIIFDSRHESKHEGITLTVEGSVSMQLSSKNVGVFEAFYNSAKPVTLMNYVVEFQKSGKIPPGRTEVPFELPLKPKGSKKLLETYHGVFITIQYVIKCEVKKSMLNKDLVKVLEFMIEKPTENVHSFTPKPVPFTVTPETLQNVKTKSQVPNFKVVGKLDSNICRINDPLSGELQIVSCDSRIHSIELQLVRVETCGCAEGFAKEATEVQNIQIADGNVCRNLTIPIHMVFPRLFTCPTLIDTNFKIEFEVNLVIVFEDNHLITQNFSIKIVRH